MAYCFSIVGLILGIILAILSALVTWYSIRLLIFSGAHVPSKEVSYSALARLTYPRLKIWVDIVMVIFCLGIATTYLIAMGDMIPSLLETIFGKSIPWIFESRVLWLTGKYFFFGTQEFFHLGNKNNLVNSDVLSFNFCLI